MVDTAVEMSGNFFELPTLLAEPLENLLVDRFLHLESADCHARIVR